MDFFLSSRNENSEFQKNTKRTKTTQRKPNNNTPPPFSLPVFTNTMAPERQIDENQDREIYRRKCHFLCKKIDPLSDNPNFSLFFDFPLFSIFVFQFFRFFQKTAFWEKIEIVEIINCCLMGESFCVKIARNGDFDFDLDFFLVFVFFFALEAKLKKRNGKKVCLLKPQKKNSNQE
mgnify:CR=1 FL=1